MLLFRNRKDTDLVTVLVLLGIAVLLFMRGAPLSDAVALMMLVALPFTGVITMGETSPDSARPTSC